MNIEKIYITSFMGIKEKEYDLSGSLNMIYGENEAGKSSLCSFIVFLLYGFGKKGEHSDYEPWQGGNLSGYIIVNALGRRIRISRTQKGSRSDPPEITDADTAEPLFKDDTRSPGEIIFGISRETFINTLFISSSDMSFAKDMSETEKKLQNLVSGAEEDISYTGAKKALEDAEKLLANTRKGNEGSIIKAQELTARLSFDLENARQKAARCREIADKLADCDAGIKECEKRLSEIKTETDEKIKAETLKRENEKEALLKEIEALSGSEEYDILPEEIISMLSDADAAIRSDAERSAVYKTEAESASEKLNNAKKPSLLFIIPAVLMLLFLCGGFFAKGIIAIALFAASFISFAVFIALAVLYIVRKKEQKDARLALMLSQKKYESALSSLADHKAYFARSAQFYGYSGDISETAFLNSLIMRSKNAEIRDTKKTDAEDKLRALQEMMKLGISSDNEEKTALSEKKERLMALKASLAREYEASKSNFEPPDEIMARINAISAEKEKDEKKLKAIRLSLSALSLAFSEMQTEFAPRLIEKANEIFSYLSGGGRYLRFDRSFKITVEQGGGSHDISKFSSGTKDAAYLAVRIAVGDMITGGGAILLDDPFMTFDDTRLKRGMKMLKDLSEKYQIIILSCRKETFAEYNDIPIINI